MVTLLVAVGVLAAGGVYAVGIAGESQIPQRPRIAGEPGTGPKLPACTQTMAPPDSLSSTLRAAPEGSVICLRSGTYDRGLTLAGISPVSVIVIRPAPHAAVIVNYLTIMGGPTRNLAFLGFAAPSAFRGGVAIVADNGPVGGITFAYDDFQGGWIWNRSSGSGYGPALYVRNLSGRASNLNKIDAQHDRFINWTPAPQGAEGTVQLTGQAKTATVVADNLISGGLSDGIHISGANAVITGNEISDKWQGAGSQCEGFQANVCPHTDAIQLEGAHDVRISGNWLHNNTDGILADDGPNDGVTVRNNVLSMDPVHGGGRVIEGEFNGTFDHNTFTGEVNVGQDHGGDRSTIAFTNNVLDGAISYFPSEAQGVTFATEDYNLWRGGGGKGTHDLTGTPRFRNRSGWCYGHVCSATYLGYRLVPNSLGFRAGASGTSMGWEGDPTAPGRATPDSARAMR